jgi:hypothetical protein
MTPPTKPPRVPASRVQVTCRGLGPVLDSLPRGAPSAGQRLPVRTGEGHNLLAVRWNGPKHVAGEVLATLGEAANQTPQPPVTAVEPTQSQDALDDRLHLVALPASSILGAWLPSPDLSLLHMGDRL